MNRSNVRHNRRTNGERGRGWLERLVSGLGTGVLVVLVLGLGAVGWYWTETVTVRRVEVEGAERSDGEAIRELAAVDVGTRLYGISVEDLTGRVRTVPWVRAVDVDRIPTGVLQLEVEEYVPRAVAVTGRGRPAYYLAIGARALPLDGPPVSDLPLVHGLPDERSDYDRTAHPALGGLLRSLAARSDRAPLVSAIEVGGSDGLTLEVGPDPSGGSVSVVLGEGGYSDKITRLESFWAQRVQGADLRFHRIDLRFDGQVVTRQDPFSSTAR